MFLGRSNKCVTVWAILYGLFYYSKTDHVTLITWPINVVTSIYEAKRCHKPAQQFSRRLFGKDFCRFWERLTN